VAGLSVDVPFRAHYQWLSSFGITTSVPRVGRVARVKLGEHAGFFVINRRIKVTFEHPFMARRGDEWGFCSADLLQVGDWLIGQDQREERIESIERIDAPARTVSIHVPGTNTYLAEGVWVHNDVNEVNQSGVANEATGQSSIASVSHASGSHASGSHMSSHSGSGSGKHSGSSFHSSSHLSGSHSSSHHSGSIHTAIG
jgi:hypothetical protein